MFCAWKLNAWRVGMWLYVVVVVPDKKAFKEYLSLNSNEFGTRSERTVVYIDTVTVV
tara:strand:+ start:32 stop:202 length:171 start_codon:yes stop_codon:yes gene_type:complete